MHRKRLHSLQGELYIFALILMATLLRVVLIYFNWPTTNSDEGNMGILARHVAYNSEVPFFFYGHPYMGPIEGYLAAPLFHVFGPSTFALRLGLLPFFPLFLICMYYLTRLLYTQKLAVFTIILLCFGSQDIISRQLKAVGEYPEMLFFAAFISLVVSWLAFSYHTVDEQSRTTTRRVFIYGVLGLVVGVALWVDFLILPFLGTGIIVLLLCCRRELVSRASICLLLGILIGAFPLLYYNIMAPLKDGTIAAVLSIRQSGAHLQLLPQIIGTLMVSLPNVTGFNPLCPPQAFPYLGVPNMHCIVVQGSWGLGYLILWTLATFFAVRTIWQGWKGKSLFTPEWGLVERQSIIRQYCRLMLLASTGGTIVLYATSPVAALYSDTSARYLVCLLVATPATLWPLCKGIGRWLQLQPQPDPQPQPRPTDAINCQADAINRVPAFPPDKSDSPTDAINCQADAINRVPTFPPDKSAFTRGLILLLILMMFVQGTFRTFSQIPNAQVSYRQQDQLIQKLLSLGATRIYSEYWTCNRLTFQSQEQIICSSLYANLTPGFDRYLPYQYIVRRSPHPAYVFPQGAQQTRVMDARLQKNRQFSSGYQRLVFEGYVIYVPSIQRQSKPVA